MRHHGIGNTPHDPMLSAARCAIHFGEVVNRRSMLRIRKTESPPATGSKEGASEAGKGAMAPVGDLPPAGAEVGRTLPKSAELRDLPLEVEESRCCIPFRDWQVSEHQRSACGLSLERCHFVDPTVEVNHIQGL